MKLALAVILTGFSVASFAHPITCGTRYTDGTEIVNLVTKDHGSGTTEWEFSAPDVFYKVSLTAEGAADFYLEDRRSAGATARFTGKWDHTSAGELNLANPNYPDRGMLLNCTAK